MGNDVWYGTCSYWTDDWNNVKTNSLGIPVCPHCNAPGFQTTIEAWMDGARKFQAAGNPGYLNFLAQSKEMCLRRSLTISGISSHRPETFLEWYKAWIREHPNGRDTPNPRSSGD